MSLNFWTFTSAWGLYLNGEIASGGAPQKLGVIIRQHALSP
jgi:hypothetical protein